MAEFSELPLPYRLQMAAYPWRRVEPLAWTSLAVPLHQARIGLVTTAGLFRPGIDPPFRRVPGGDCSFRILPDDGPLAELRLGQTSSAFDPSAIESDRNVALPIDRLRTLVGLGEIGSAAPRHLSFNGSITAPNGLVADTAAAAAEIFTADRVEAALLVPV